MRRRFKRRRQRFSGSYSTSIFRQRIISVCRCRSHAEARGHPHEGSKRIGLHLAHHPAAVRLDRDLADAEFSTDLLIQEARYDQRHDLAG